MLTKYVVLTGVSPLCPPVQDTFVLVTMYHQQHLCLLPFFLWEVNLDSENRKKGPPCDSKTRLLILDSYTHTRPCPCFLQSVQRTPLNPSPQGNGVRGRAGQSRSSPVRLLQFLEAQNEKRTINTRTRGKTLFVSLSQFVSFLNIASKNERRQLSQYFLRNDH